MSATDVNLTAWMKASVDALLRRPATRGGHHSRPLGQRKLRRRSTADPASVASIVSQPRQKVKTGADALETCTSTGPTL